MLGVHVDWQSRRLHVGALRCHHGFAGALAILAGALVAYHDRRDWRAWWPRVD